MVADIVTVRFKDLAELLRAEQTVGAKTEGFLTRELFLVGELVAADVRRGYDPYSSQGMMGIQTKVFTSGVWVVQTLRKSRNMMRRRPNFGPFIFKKAFYPAMKNNENNVLEAANRAMVEARGFWEA